MAKLRLEFEGLALYEIETLFPLLASTEGVSNVDFTAKSREDADGNFFVAPPIDVILNLATHGIESAGAGVALAAGSHLYKIVGEAIVDKMVGWIKSKGRRRGYSVTLYGPDDKPIITLTVCVPPLLERSTSHHLRLSRQVRTALSTVIAISLKVLPGAG
jgi:hypothetical protein